MIVLLLTTKQLFQIKLLDKKGSKIDNDNDNDNNNDNDNVFILHTHN